MIIAVSDTSSIAIIGAGQAGAQAAQSLRHAGFDGRLELIGDEPFAPYQRPPLSKAYLAGDLEADRLTILPERFYAESEIECRFGSPVEEFLVREHRIALADGTVIDFDKALITTGSRSRPLPLPGADLDGVYALRNIHDVDRLRPRLEAGQRAIIIGGGYIGMEVAAVVRKAGLEVCVIEAAERIMARATCAAVSEYFEALHADNGVRIETGAGVTGIAAGDGELVVATSSGPRAGEWVLIGIGGQPNVELAADAGLAIDNGIAVDEFCRTSAPDVFAAGDCTSFPSARYGRRIRLESVQNAIDQAKAAALAMLDRGEAYDPVPWFWSDQYDTKFQIAGLNQDADQFIVRGDPASGSFAVGYLQAGRLIALDAINRPRDYMQARRMVPTAEPVDVAKLADAEVPLAKIGA